ncbi:MAG: phage tail protein [Anaerolineales bacterium]
MADPLISFKFSLDMGDNVTGFFTECSGIGSETEVTDHLVVDENGVDVVMKLPGRLKYTDITLKRGITDTMDIWDWRQKVEEGKIDDARTNCSIIMYDREGTPAAQWDLINAWPSKVTGPEFKSDSNDYGVEEVVLVHEGMRRVSV